MRNLKESRDLNAALLLARGPCLQYFVVGCLLNRHLCHPPCFSYEKFGQLYMQLVYKFLLQVLRVSCMRNVDGLMSALVYNISLRISLTYDL